MDTVGPRQRTRNNGNATDWGSGIDARACKLLADEAMKEGRTVDHNLGRHRSIVRRDNLPAQLLGVGCR